MKFDFGEMVRVVYTCDEYSRYRGEVCVIRQLFALGRPDWYQVFMLSDGSLQYGSERCFAKIPPQQEPDAMRTRTPVEDAELA